MRIRYGRLRPGSQEVDWSFVSHCDCDGIGGFARLLRESGATIEKLPETKHPHQGIIAPFWKLWRGNQNHKVCADRRDWTQPQPASQTPSNLVAWHLFSEEETAEIRKKCRRNKITVNSHLLKHLDQAVRPSIKRPHAAIPWLIPVNVRGDITLADDTANHASYVEPRIAEDDSPAEIQSQILHRLNRGEHRANYLLLSLGKFFSHQTKVRLIKKDRAKPKGNIGSFSNLGVWDSEKAIDTDDSWLFCPPVVKGQLLGAGCVTFQNRLSLTIQGHDDLSTQPQTVKKWMTHWIDSI